MTCDKNRSMLIVDDEEDLLDILVDFFSDDFNVFGASEGGEALNLINQHPEIEFVLTDINMPNGLDGWSLIDEIHKMKLKAPPSIFIISGFLDNLNPDSTRIKSYPLVKSTFAKPFNFEEIMQQLDECTNTK